MSMSDRHSPGKVRARLEKIVRNNPEDFAEPYPMPDPPPERIYVWFGTATGNIRKWSREPFGEGAEYVLTAAKDVKIERLTDKIDGLESELRSALQIIFRRGDDKARFWLAANYPEFEGE